MKGARLLFPLASLSAMLGLTGLPGTGLAWPGPVPKTGQSICYDKAGNEISCDIPKGDPLYGQDGQLQKGVAWPKPRFVRLVNTFDDTGVGGGMAGNRICDGTERCNGVVKDRLTALKWLADVSCITQVNWVTALHRTNALANGQCGLRDGSRPGAWRLPNRNELLSLIDVGCSAPAISDRLGTGCLSSDPDPVFSFPEIGRGLEFWTSGGDYVLSESGGMWHCSYDLCGEPEEWGGDVWPVRGGR